MMPSVIVDRMPIATKTAAGAADRLRSLLIERASLAP